MKIGRNQRCYCGSGKKYKRCHGSVSNQINRNSPVVLGPEFTHMLEKQRATEKIREGQQGQGRPIVSISADNRRFVAVGNTLHWSSTWKTFPDFLGSYIKKVLGEAWGRAELAKPLENRHPIMQWYDAYCKYQQKTITTPGQVSTASVTGVVACYLGLAYSLYLLDHNVELQNRLVRRLKNISNFQGAYYELVIANVLIRAGFKLTLEDEEDGESKHCEFAAVSKRTGKKYWVEAKMRSITGLLGKTKEDGTSDSNPISHLIPHLNSALNKPAADERLIFIDLNTDIGFTGDGKPLWFDRAIARLEQYEAKELPKDKTAYLFVTNIPFHRSLSGDPTIAVCPYGLGIADFNRPGYMRLSEIYRQKHIDAYDIGNMFLKYLIFPSTFDGSLPSEAFGEESNRVIIGETYFFENVGGGIVGTVTAATVNEPEKQIYIGITTQDGRVLMLREPMSDDELAEYRSHRDSYFGKVLTVSKQISDPYGFFEWLMEANKKESREHLLKQLATAEDFENLKEINDSDLLVEYCERIVAAFLEKNSLGTDRI